MKPYENRMRSKFSILIFLFLTTVLVPSCDSGSKDSEKALPLLLGYASSETAKLQAANRSAAEASAAFQAAVGRVTFEAEQGILVYNNPIPKGAKRLLALFPFHSFSHRSKDPVFPIVIPTALSTPSRSCNTAQCALSFSEPTTIGGFEYCQSGNLNSGTFSPNGLRVFLVFSGGTLTDDLGYTSQMEGKVNFDNCLKRSTDYLNYPNVTSSFVSGEMDYSGMSTQTFSNVSKSATSILADIVIQEDSTLVSSNFSSNGGPAQTINITQAIDLTIDSSITNISQTASTFSASYVEVLTGSVNLSGTVGSTNVNISKTYSNTRFTYDVTCQVDFSTKSGNCSITPK